MKLDSLTNPAEVAAMLDPGLNSLMQARSLDSNAENIASTKIGQVAEDFESLFLSLMLKEMRNTLDQSSGGLFGSESSDSYGGMFDMLMGQALAKGRHLGIADLVEKRSVAEYKARQQQVDSTPTPTGVINAG